MTGTADWKEVHEFWFGDLSPENDFMPSKEQQGTWWQKSELFDAEIRERFLPHIHAAATEQFKQWLTDPRGRLALIILLDQMTRNAFRETAGMYAYDNIALYLALSGIAAGADQTLHPIERVFMYMPLEHSEDRQIQTQNVALFKTLAEEMKGEEHENLFNSFLDFAKQHDVIVQEFGRFPHRNALLARTSTPEEVAFLKQPNSGF